MKLATFVVEQWRRIGAVLADDTTVLDLGLYPTSGDVIALEIEKIGILRNRFVKS